LGVTARESKPAPPTFPPHTDAPADPLRNSSPRRALFGYSKPETRRLLDLASHMVEELTDELTRQQGELAEKEALLVRALAECAETTSQLQSSRTELEQARAEHNRQMQQEPERVVGDALVSAHRAAAKIITDARRTAESLLESARENASMIQGEADSVIEQAEIRALALGEQAASEVENLQAEYALLRATVERERHVWTAFLRRALASVAEVSLDPDGERSQQALMDLEGDLRGGIRPPERTSIGPADGSG
jgi:cell division septum initiation protein DivIVA